MSLVCCLGGQTTSTLAWATADGQSHQLRWWHDSFTHKQRKSVAVPVSFYTGWTFFLGGGLEKDFPRGLIMSGSAPPGRCCALEDGRAHTSDITEWACQSKAKLPHRLASRQTGRPDTQCSSCRPAAAESTLHSAVYLFTPPTRFPLKTRKPESETNYQLPVSEKQGNLLAGFPLIRSQEVNLVIWKF